MSPNDNTSFANSPMTVFDLGSSSVRAITAVMTDRGLLRILGEAENTRFSAIEYGVVRNSSNAGYMIKENMRYLMNQTGKGEMKSAFYLMGGSSTQVVSVVATMDLGRKRKVTQSVLKQLEQQCMDMISSKYPQLCSLAITPDYYDLDGQEQDETPTPDQTALLVKAHFSVFVAKKELQEHAQGSFDRTDIQVESPLMRLDAQLTAFATEQDLQDGCAILDMGAHTTTIGIYKQTQFIYATVIPKGGDDLTEAIAACGCTMPIAEQVKCKYATATPEQQEKDRKMRLPKENGDSIIVTTKEISQAINDELEILMRMISERIDKYRERFTKIYLTGGACKLEGIADYIEERLGIQVDYGCHEEWLEEDTKEKYYEPQYASLIGGLAMAYDYRKINGNVVNSTKKPKRGILEPIKNSLVNLFSGQEEDIS